MNRQYKHYQKLNKYHHEKHHPHIFLFVVVALVGIGVMLMSFPSQRTGSTVLTARVVAPPVQSWDGHMCPSDNDPVCAQGRTYRNACYAVLDGVVDFDLGRCS